MKTILIMLFTAISLSVFSQDTSVVQLEYFFDSDIGFGKNNIVNVTPAQMDLFLLPQILPILPLAITSCISAPKTVMANGALQQEEILKCLHRS